VASLKNSNDLSGTVDKACQENLFTRGGVAGEAACGLRNRCRSEARRQRRFARFCDAGVSQDSSGVLNN
jgi:hypothetical protein